MRRPAAVLLAVLICPAAWGFSYHVVVDRARDLAGSPYQKPGPIPEFLDHLDYTQYQGVKFKRDRALWPQARFHVQFFSPGYLYKDPVQVNVVADNDIHRIAYDPTYFTYPDGIDASRIPPNLGFAGFRLHYDPPGQPDDAKEFLVFLGASYFRGRALSMDYGLSARGAAIETGMDHPEPFPRFTEFWLVRPAPNAGIMTAYALLNGSNVTGAFRFTIRPGQDVLRMDVVATLFLRREVAKLGLAPLTSMYFYGIGDHRPPAYLRPEIHDSDGLLIHDADNQWLWRSLRNQGEVTITRFAMPTPQGFGLLQRERDFDNYQSLHAHYQDRPSLWIMPTGDWGKGQIELVEIPTADEYHDNMVAFWVPEQSPQSGEPLRYCYRMVWNANGPGSPLARVVATRTAERKTAKVVIAEFAAGEPSLTHQQLQTDIQVHGGKLLHTRLRRDPAYGVWRLTLRILPTRGERLRIRARLLHDGKPLSETWTYAIQPPIKRNP